MYEENLQKWLIKNYHDNNSEMQIEQLHLYGKNHPETGLHKKVIGVSFSEKISVRDPYTKKKDEKDIKPFMVNSSVNLFEKGIIALATEDLQLKEQLEQYTIKGISPTGRPTYTSDNEHFVDALNLCMLGFTKHYDALVRVQLARRISVISSLDKALLAQKGTTLASGLEVETTRESAVVNNKKEKEAAVTKTATPLKSFGVRHKSTRTGRTSFRSRNKF